MIPKVYHSDEHGIALDSMDEDALKILWRLERHGFQARLVGGGVRDLLLHKAPKDFDIATDARPNEIRKIFNNSRVIGKRFKLVHIYFGRGKIVEVATFRASDNGEDDELHTLKNDNTFGNEESDAYRRDLTINGLFYDAHSETVIDYVDGMSDLRQGIIRVIGDPERRFVEDPVRMLRVVRHAVRAGFAIEATTWSALEQQNGLLDLCAPMRLFEELKKDLGSGHALSIFRLLHQGGLLSRLIPGITEDHLSFNAVLSDLLNNIDEFNLVNEEFPFSLFLTAIIICMQRLVPDSSDQAKNRFPLSDDTLDFFLQDPAWSMNGLPRRVRENARANIGLWNNLVAAVVHDCSLVSEHVRVSRREARHADQIMLLHRVLPTQDYDRAIYEKVLEARALGQS
jgi:poly(A) polymerase